MRRLIILLVTVTIFGQNCEQITKDRTCLKIVETPIHVNGKMAKVFDILSEDGRFGLYRQPGECFNVLVDNQTTQPTTLHWHGLILPWREDGVAFVTQYPIPPKKSQGYNFKLHQEGTFWMHSHYGLQEQRLMAAPLIITNDKTPQAVVFLEDFSFEMPGEIWRNLRKNYNTPEPRNLPEPKSSLNDVDYDAFLCNRRTSQDPPTAELIPGKDFILRIINGSAMTNFFVMLDRFDAEIIAVDGNPVYPLAVDSIELSVGQRADVRLKIPNKPTSFPLYAVAQGTNQFTGMSLQTKGTPKAIITDFTDHAIGRITNKLDAKLRPKYPLSRRAVDKRYHVVLDGDMWRYVWTMNGHAWPNNVPLMVKEGDRVEIVMENRTLMGHPMHLHGHVFQVTGLNGRAINGPIRDTAFVPPGETVTIQFDATNPGIWAFHCHFLYHMWGGMFTTVNYEGVEPIKFNQKTFNRYLNRYGGR